VNLTALLHECITVAQPRLDATGVTMQNESGGEPILIRAQAEPLRRAILNLLINAEQHAGENGRVFARLTRTRRRALIDIANSGAAIPRANRRKIFELFFTTRPGGTGLGLFLARAAIQHTGGHLTLEHLDPYATCFRVDLPLAREPARKERNQPKPANDSQKEHAP